MSRKRCCCGGSTPGAYPCQPCPTPIPPATTREWIVSVNVDGIIGDSAGLGVVNPVDFYQPCLAGDCVRTVYSRRGANNTDFMSSDCLTRVCDGIVDTKADTDSGSHVIRWSFCTEVSPLVPFPDPALPDIQNTQTGGAFIEWVRPNLGWDFANCTYLGSGGEDCCTVIKVYFQYQDTFSYLRWDSDANGCFSYTETMTTPVQTWTCYYVRRVAPGQFFAEGAYYLLRCEYPDAYDTVGGTAPFYRCSIAGGVVCSAQHGASTSPPTTWKPPANINLVRLS